ncbi:hypothetical protein [Psychrobacillus vulpis]|nr:hypothetical protein [Psychrobacillus vulpis]
MIFILNELNHLKEDYSKCDNLLIKEQILLDINLLNEALTLLNQEERLAL